MTAGRPRLVREICAEVADRLSTEAGVTCVQWHDKGLWGRAWIEDRKVLAPRPTTRKRLFVFAHECAHIALDHQRRRTPVHRMEYEAEQWAIAAFDRHGVEIPPGSIDKAKQYVGYKIHQAIRRGARRIDDEALAWCAPYHTRTVQRWMRRRNGGVIASFFAFMR